MPGSRATGGWGALCAGLLALLLAVAPVQGQGGSVSGTVVEGRTLQPVIGAQVVVEGTGRGALTDARGRFMIPGLTGSTVQLRVQMLGYRTVQQTAAVGASDVRVVLEQSAIELDAVVVTGTAGATTKRAVGNAVAQVDVAEISQVAPAANVGQLVNARTPGVVVRPPSGLAGAGSRIVIRGRNSISLSGDPLIYVDGIRVDNRGPTGGNGTASGSRLNDFNPEDIESIEIIKGPAAATLYGTEASNGVIQIITKKGRPGETRINATVRQGAAWLMNPEERWPVNYFREASGEVVEFNIAATEAAAGRPIFRTGHLQGYSLSASGGSEEFQYYAGADFDRDEGALPTNQAERISGRLNLSFQPQKTLQVSTQAGVILNRVDFGPSGLVFDAVLSRPGNRNTPSRGFFRAPPEAWNASSFVSQNTNRFTGGIEVSHNPREWFTHRLRTGLDYSSVNDVNLTPLLPPEHARFFSAGMAAGSKSINQDNVLTSTVDYSGTASLSLREGLVSATSVGAQFYRSNLVELDAEGREFPSSGITSIAGAAQRFGRDDATENVTVGVFVQEQISWQDRLFLTGAVRADDNSAFGEEFDLVVYPKVSASWVLNEEPFWNVPFVDAFRLRAAYGESGQQPQAFAALRTFDPVTGQGGAPAVTPQFVGNPDLGPERGQEIEMGFEAGLFGQRVGVDFTVYHQRTKDAIVLRDVAPSSGFWRQQYVNLGETLNEGVELLLTAQAVQLPTVGWDVAVNLSANRNEVVSLGLEGTEFLEFGIARNRHQPGYPINAFFSRKIVSAERGPNGRPTNILCDDGQGGGVPCANAPRLYSGHPDPSLEGSVTSTLTLFNRLRFYGMVDFKRGHRLWSSSLWCPGILGCEDEIYPERFDPVYAASSVLGITDDARWVMDMSFAKLRELSVNYSLPDGLAQRFGMSRASITVAGRNLHTWTDFQGLDPENVNSFGGSGLAFEQNEMPQLAQFVTTFNVTF